MKARRIVTAVTATGAVIVFASPAMAATAPRLVGTFKTGTTVTASTNSSSVGTASTKPYSFAPKCASGSCATQITRFSNDGTKRSYVIKPVSATRYTGAYNYLASCYNPNGSLRVRNAYNQHETLTINITRSANGKVTAYQGKLVIAFTPNSTGQANRCAQGNVTYALKAPVA